MQKGKSNFRFVVNANAETIHNLIQSFLGANGFNAKFENGITYYMQQDFMWGNRFFEYYVDGNQVTILAYIGKFKKPILLDDSFVGSVPKQEYKKLLDTLFAALNQLNVAGQTGANWQNSVPQQAAYGTQDMNGQQAAYGSQPPYMDISQQTNQFADNVNKSKERMAICGFVISIIGLVLSCLGYMIGGILLVLEIYFAVNGLKTSKKGLSIATFVLCGVSVLIFIAQIILVATLS